MARPTKFNEERAASIIEAIKVGATRKAATERAGIGYNTFLRWIEKGERAKVGPFWEFRESLTRAEAEVETTYAAVFKAAAQPHDVTTVSETDDVEIRVRKVILSDDTVINGVTYPRGTKIEEPVSIPIHRKTVSTSREFDWRAAESWLKRRRTPEWGDTQKVEHGNADNKPFYIVGWGSGTDPGSTSDPSSDSGGG